MLPLPPILMVKLLPLPTANPLLRPTLLLRKPTLPLPLMVATLLSPTPMVRLPPTVKVELPLRLKSTLKPEQNKTNSLLFLFYKV